VVSPTTHPYPYWDHSQDPDGYIEANKPGVQLGHLTSLKSLRLHVAHHPWRETYMPISARTNAPSPAMTAVLPHQLEELHIFGPLQLVGLRCLNHASLTASAPEDLQVLQQLATLQEPWDLTLRVEFATHPAQPAHEAPGRRHLDAATPPWSPRAGSARSRNPEPTNGLVTQQSDCDMED
jgi:hypothetical protein